MYWPRNERLIVKLQLQIWKVQKRKDDGTWVTQPLVLIHRWRSCNSTAYLEIQVLVDIITLVERVGLKTHRLHVWVTCHQICNLFESHTTLIFVTLQKYAQTRCMVYDEAYRIITVALFNEDIKHWIPKNGSVEVTRTHVTDPTSVSLRWPICILKLLCRV